MPAVKLVLLLFLSLMGSAFADWADQRDLVVADAQSSRGGIRVTYLGVNGYQLEAAGHALLIDPYFSRVKLGAAAFDQAIEPDPERVTVGLSHARRKVDAVLVTHAHFDHLLDVPLIMRRTGARLVAGPSAVNLVRSLGLPATQCRPVQPGAVRRIGPWTIRAVAARHDRLFDLILPYPGTAPTPARPPVKVSDWVVGEPLAFVIEAVGERIYVDSGGTAGALPQVGKVDLAILGVALRDSRRRFAPLVRGLQPRFVLPSHQDDFFQPFARGFIFAPLSDFPQVRSIFAREKLPGQLILLDYFRPWTLR